MTNTVGSQQDLFDGCAYCGEPFEPDVRYPVYANEAPDGEFEVKSFCDERCKAAWLAER